jgi:hypothetical protein
MTENTARFASPQRESPLQRKMQKLIGKNTNITKNKK